MPRARAEPARWQLLLSCEHGGNRVPAPYRPLFAPHGALLATHRGLDIGALAAARRLQRHTGAPLIAATVTRLLVDLNRSQRHPRLFSNISCDLSPDKRQEVLRRHYQPYRARVTDWIEARIARGERVLHLSVHSFTPVLDGRRRRADVGLLYDPRRAGETRLCRRWQALLTEAGWQARRNYPYRGTADGLVAALRRRFPASTYLGVELELNQGGLQEAVVRRRLFADIDRSFAIVRDALR